MDRIKSSYSTQANYNHYVVLHVYKYMCIRFFPMAIILVILASWVTCSVEWLTLAGEICLSRDLAGIS